MSQEYATGPCHMFAGVAANKSPVYLGTAEKAPIIPKTYLYDPVFNDLGGQTGSYDKVFQGFTVQISLMLTRFNWSVASQMTSVPNWINGVPGSHLLSHYIPMGQSGASFPFWIAFPYASAPGYPGMPGGFRFWNCTLAFDQLIPGSTAARWQMVLEGDRAFPAKANSPVGQPAIAANAVPVGAIVFDHDMSEIARVKLN